MRAQVHENKGVIGFKGEILFRNGTCSRSKAHDVKTAKCIYNNELCAASTLVCSV
jgi:hypothetical protein